MVKTDIIKEMKKETKSGINIDKSMDTKLDIWTNSKMVKRDKNDQNGQKILIFIRSVVLTVSITSSRQNGRGQNLHLHCHPLHKEVPHTSYKFLNKYHYQIINLL
jgi:hypothetical protein